MRVKYERKNEDEFSVWKESYYKEHEDEYIDAAMVIAKRKTKGEITEREADALRCNLNEGFFPKTIDDFTEEITGYVVHTYKEHFFVANEKDGTIEKVAICDCKLNIEEFDLEL